ncbi:MAG TPA: CDP-diacylglycerol--glycerol-3-phosphate 3-phosphatidyltransferase [Candidatus Scatomorpha merdigallinarum]|nr:CDP-diacylglycerol--glycerol-3-phosphate 3-phosphatidyltransferase [Candidatus Scatomorpha merdigallinarum]
MKLTTASKITIARVALIPVVLLLMYIDFPGHMYWALAVFIIASCSDFVDGYIARHYNQVSNFGKFVDPLADKLLVISVMLVYVDWGYMPAWAAIIVVARELCVTGLRLVAVEGGKVIAAAWSGKIKTASTMVCFCLMMLPVPKFVISVCWIIVVLTTVYSGVEYFIKNADVFK